MESKEAPRRAVSEFQNYNNLKRINSLKIKYLRFDKKNKSRFCLVKENYNQPTFDTKCVKIMTLEASQNNNPILKECGQAKFQLPQLIRTTSWLCIMME